MGCGCGCGCGCLGFGGEVDMGGKSCNTLARSEGKLGIGSDVVSVTGEGGDLGAFFFG